MNKTHGQLLKEWATKKGISTQEIALKRGVNRQSVYQDFRKKSLKMTTLESYCKIYGIDITQLLSNTEDLKSSDSYNNEDIYFIKYISALEDRVNIQAKIITMLLTVCEQVK